MLTFMISPTSASMAVWLNTKFVVFVYYLEENAFNKNLECRLNTSEGLEQLYNFYYGGQH